MQFISVYGRVRVTRSCGYIAQSDPKKKNKCTRSMFSEGTTTSFYCECDEDFCNGNSRSERIAHLSFLALIAAVLIASLALN